MAIWSRAHASSTKYVLLPISSRVLTNPVSKSNHSAAIGSLFGNDPAAASSTQISFLASGQ